MSRFETLVAWVRVALFSWMFLNAGIRMARGTPLSAADAAVLMAVLRAARRD